MKIIGNIKSFFSRIKAKIASHLVEDAALWHKMWSMRFSLLTTAYTTAAGAWLVLPDSVKPEFSNTQKMVLAGIGVMLPVASMVARVVKQQNLNPPIQVTVPPPKENP